MTLWYYNVYGCRGWRLAKLRLGVENSERLILGRRLLNITKLLIHYPSLWISSFKPSLTADTNFGQFWCVTFLLCGGGESIYLSLTSVARPPSERHVSQGSTRVMNSFCLYNKSADSIWTLDWTQWWYSEASFVEFNYVYIYIGPSLDSMKNMQISKTAYLIWGSRVLMWTRKYVISNQQMHIHC